MRSGRLVFERLGFSLKTGDHPEFCVSQLFRLRVVLLFTEQNLVGACLLIRAFRVLCNLTKRFRSILFR